MRNLYRPFACFSLILLFGLNSCKQENAKPDYRHEMRKFVEKISANGRALRPGFIVVPQNGLALLSSDGTSTGTAESAYINSIDGVGQEELWYGYDNQDDQTTPELEHEDLLKMGIFARSHGLSVMVTDYASTPSKIDDSYSKNYANNFISFCADHRELDNVPAYPQVPFNITNSSISNLADAKNFLYIISPSAFATKEEFIHAIEISNYDLVVMDLYFDETTMINAADLNRIHTKLNGGNRKVICYMSIGEAESYRWYWKPYWNAAPPSFIVAEDPDWIDNFSVRYWDPNWQAIICGMNDSYLKRIVDAGFDGAYLDLVSEYEYFEE